MNRRPGEVALYLRSGTLHPLEEFDLVAGGDGDDGLAPGRSPTLDAHLADTATLLLRLRRQHVDAEHGDLEELLDGGLDLELVGVVVDGEGVLRVLRVVHRLLADDRSQDDLGGVQRHAYTSVIVSSAGITMSSVSAFRTSTVLSESARMISTRGRLLAQPSTFSPAPPPPPAPSPRVFVSCVPRWRPASCAFTTWGITAVFTGAAKSPSGSSIVPTSAPVLR